MIWVALVTANITLVIALSRDWDKITLDQAMVAIVALATVLDVTVPHGHPLRNFRTLPQLILIVIFAFTPIPVAFHEHIRGMVTRNVIVELHTPKGNGNGKR
jgi:hypothetical protein